MVSTQTSLKLNWCGTYSNRWVLKFEIMPIYLFLGCCILLTFLQRNKVDRLKAVFQVSRIFHLCPVLPTVEFPFPWICLHNWKVVSVITKLPNDYVLSRQTNACIKDSSFLACDAVGPDVSKAFCLHFLGSNNLCGLLGCRRWRQHR